MKPSFLLPILLAFNFVSVSCSRTGDLSGDLFVMRGDKLMRGAGAQIRVIPASERLESELPTIIREFDREYAEQLEQDEKECKKDVQLEKQMKSDPAIQKKIDEQAKARLAKNSTIGPDSARSLAELDILVNDLKGGKCPFAPRDWYDGFVKYIYTRVQKLVPPSELRVFLADANGHYEVNGLPVGRYYLSAALRSEGIWLVPVQIKPGAQKVHLSDANSGEWRFLTKNAPD